MGTKIKYLIILFVMSVAIAIAEGKKSACEQKKKVGRCRARKPRFYYNGSTQQCERFFYGGCRGNDNNFMTKNDCEKACVKSTTTKAPCGPVCAMHCQYGNFLDANGCPICKCKPNPACKQKMKVGPCRARIPRYFFNAKIEKCDKFYYGGCRANGNNFKTLGDCFVACPSIPVCKQKKVIGPCKAAHRRYFFNGKECKQFIYGGCKGNDNNFMTEDGCKKTCPAAPCPEIMCIKPCPDGYATDSKGCQTCDCRPKPATTTTAPCGPVCEIYCKYGNVLDANGCKTCKCKPNPAPCPQLRCKPCDNGYRKDSKGCQTCDCIPKPAPCPQLRCKPCDNGYRKDSKGCQTCDCIPKPVPKRCSRRLGRGFFRKRKCIKFWFG